ncbi:MAG: hypothetical protein FWF75_07455, partial [Propionibacteriaceae bacterium]|nr:hypothetical protein [Propionibacteriaceae bacterium]
QSTPAPDAGPSPLARVRQQWPAILERVQQHSRVTHSLLSRNVEVVDVTGTTVTLGLATAGLRDSFQHGSHIATLTTALKEVFRADLTVQAVVGGPGAAASAPAPSAPAPSAPSAPSAPPDGAPHHRGPVSHRPHPIENDPWEPPDDDAPADEVSADDPDLDDGRSAAELLAGVLGAEPIEEQTDE